VKAPKGFADLTLDQGEITAVDTSSDKVTIKRLDGVSVTATATDKTIVCKDGKAATLADLDKGDRARLVQVRSEKFTGLRKIVAFTAKNDDAAPARAAADFGEDDVESLLDGTF
jgi:hypothetical protein